MSTFLFDEFDETSPTAWKQKIQVDLKGADYNDTLLWKTSEGITVKPFYTKEDSTQIKIDLPSKGFNICQTIFIDDIKIANSLALDALLRGANTIQFIANKTFNYTDLLKKIDLKNTAFYFKFNFLDANFTNELYQFINSKNTYFQIDIIGHLAKTGNWFHNLKEDHKHLEEIVNQTPNCISVNASLYQNAGANGVQQLAYALAHANEYLNHFDGEKAQEIHFDFSIGSNYFLEIAKLRAFRILWKTLTKAYNAENLTATIFAQPTLRNKTIYDYNVNMLRTTSECMSAILGGANTISNTSYDAIFHKSNEFGERISRNQLLILQEESYLKEAQHIADGTYYIEQLTQQLAEKALLIFKQIEKGGGFIKQLKEGVIQRKIKESANKEQDQFNANEIILLGTNKQQNDANKMQEDLQLYPFVKMRNEKTLITPIIEKRLAETIEKKRLDNE